MTEEQLLQRIIDGKLFGYVQCDIECSRTSATFFLKTSSDFQKYSSQ